MHGLVEHENVIAAGRIFGIHAHRIVDARMAHIDVAELAILTREAVAPVPLLTDRLEVLSLFGNSYELSPDDETGRKHGNDADRRNDSEPALELRILRVVLRFVTFAVAEVDHAVNEEQVDGEKDNAGYDKRDIDRRVDHVPVRSDIGKPPAVDGTDEMEDQCADYQ